MAQKQYSFDFVLNAVLNGGFSGTFTKAQQEFIRLGTEIKNLQAIQRDIAAYQKQAAAVQNTSGKLENLRHQYELINRQISETTGSTTALEREKLKLEQRIANTEAALEKQRAKLDSTRDRLDAAGVSTDNLSAKDAELTEQIRALTEEQKKAAEEAGRFGSAGMQAIEAVGGAIAAAGIAEGAKAIADAYRECVDVSKAFGQGMSNVEAIADSSISEMAALTAQAKELGATTKFTARESADAMGYMAMAGWDAQEMLSGMSGVINLAAAAGEDLAQVSDIVTDNLSAFRLTAADTAHFADVLAAAAAKSNTNISIMGETFKNSSSVAGALGYSIEDVAVMTGLMANNAVKGSRAGTALRNIFNGLLGGVTLTAEAFGELDYSAVNSDGSMKGLMETVKDLRGYFDQMTEAERVNNAMEIAGMRGYNGLLAILNATDEDFQSLYASINDCSGAAERMAKVKLDNLNGDVTILNSAMEALQTTIGEQFNPELRGMTQLGTDILNWVNGLIQECPALTKGIMAGTGAFMAMGTAVVGVNAAIKVFKALNLAALFTGPAGVMLGAAAGIAGVTAAVVGFTEATRDGGPAVRELTEAARELNAAMEEAESGYESTAVEILAAANTAELYIGKLEEIQAAQGENAQQSKEYQNTLGLLLRTMPELSSCISTTTDEYGRSTYVLETDTAALRVNTEEWKKNAQARAYQEYLNSLYDQYGDVLVEAAENELELSLAEHKRDEAVRKQNDVLKRRGELWKEAERAAQKQTRETGVLTDATAFLTQEYEDLGYELEDLNEEISNAEADIKDHEEAIRRDGEAAAQAEEKMAFLEDAVKDTLKAMGLYTEEEENLTEEEAAVRDALDGTMEKVQALGEAYRKAYEEASESFAGQFGLFDEAKADAQATVEAAQKALDTQLAYWQGYAANIAVLKEQSAEDLGVTQENYDALMKFVMSGTPEAAGLAADMVKAVKSGNTQVLTDLANTLGEIEESRDQTAQDVAEWTTGLLEQTQQLVHDMEEELGALDMSEEARESGRATVQAYIDQAEGMLPQVRSAYTNVARVASISLGPPRYADSAWYANRNRGYAAGTQNAPPGWAWVGEDGPELMRMHGGEQVLPNRVSRQVAEDYGAYSRYTCAQEVQPVRPPLEVIGTAGTAEGRPKMEMHFHIAAGAPPETVSAWQDYANRGELKTVILDVLEETDADMRRRAMV
ncbi:phage tail tape measure protein [Pseudoflavonifractor sp. 524-17]|uniref:phage tail tape measure protein n=1 Tax=Pseudoflavonifractor sp. 524-17 TaxID=2304577 RepID=UPI001379EF27|nr:phage tail tape measure protein [Pseudoflavonifractor sp. 524-17]NCE63020.1 phage tail tape measure protein [Pseudoflavonifractor sp. 524-17]